MANELFCMGCMQPISEFSDSCYHCGYPAAGQNPPSYLPVRTKLSNRYVVGRALEKRSDAIVYIGYDKTARNTVLIREFYPEGLCERLSKQIVAAPEKDAAFSTCLEQFRKQARVIARMRDLPAMIPVYDLFEENGTMYAVSDQIEGMPLRRHVQMLGGHIKWEEARPLFVPLITSVSSLHAAGLYHLGISPDSIIIDSDNRLRLDGWQLACVRTEGGPLISRLPAGYAAPEQYKGSRVESSQAADVYALSATMLYALTGEEPPAAIDRVNKVAALMVPADVAEKWPAYIAPTLCDALHLDVAKRIQTAELLKERLTVAPVVEALIEDVPKAAKTEKQAPAKAGVGYKVTVAVLAVLCVLMAGVIVWLLLGGNPFGDGEPTPAPVSTATTTTAANDDTATTTTTAVPVQQLVNPYAVEQVVGMTAEQVYGKTFRGNMTVKIVGTEYSDSQPKGTILSQYPMPEALAEQGSVIEAVISAGPASAPLESVVGWDNAAARLYLETIGMKVTEVKVSVSQFEKGFVDSTNPAPGSPVTVGQEVVLYVSDVTAAPAN